MFELFEGLEEDHIDGLLGALTHREAEGVRQFLTMWRTLHNLMAPMRDAMEHHKLSPARARVLFLMRCHMSELNPTFTPSSLATLVGVTPATMTRLLDSLEERKLIRRTPDKKDRRSITITMTPLGQRTIDGILKPFAVHMDTALSQLNHQDRAMLTILLSRFDLEPAKPTQEQP